MSCAQSKSPFGKNYRLPNGSTVAINDRPLLKGTGTTALLISPGGRSRSISLAEAQALIKTCAGKQQKPKRRRSARRSTPIKPAARRSALPAARSPRPRGPVAVNNRSLGTVPNLLVVRGGKTYVHHFCKHPELFAVDGTAGVLVIRGNFKLDKNGFIQE